MSPLDPVATRAFSVEGDPGREVAVTIGRPIPEPAGDWICSFSIEGLPSAGNGTAHGIDALDALMMAMDGARKALVATGLTLRWKGGEPGDMGIPRLMPMSADERLQTEWLMRAQEAGCARLSALYLALERGDSLPMIDTTAWENTMAAVEWAVREAVKGRVQWTKRALTQEDVETVQRLRALALAALSGEECSPKLLPLVEQGLAILAGPSWREVVSQMAAWEPEPGAPPV